MEIDGASNRGIDQIRELKSHVGLAPFMGGSKVYILDEVHMLTTEAFNALLKTLEEPPPFAVFIFATTEPNKVPATIRSRCQHIPFHRITTEGIAARLRDVASMEGFEAEEPALWEVARNADGALRDALSLAEQAMALGNGKLSAEAVEAGLRWSASRRSCGVRRRARRKNSRNCLDAAFRRSVFWTRCFLSSATCGFTAFGGRRLLPASRFRTRRKNSWH